MERGSQFLHQKDSKLHTSAPVEHEQARRNRAEELTSQKPVDKIGAWLQVLERTHTGKGASEARQVAQPEVLERIKESYHKDLVIQPENIPESVYALEQRIARERGHGDVAITDGYREAKQREIVGNQTASLDRWVDYLSSDDASYPTWAKYWAFQSITKMGKLQKRVEVQPDGTEREVASFTKRDDTTVAPFAPLSPRALALTIGVMGDRLVQKGLPKDERATTNVSTLLDNDEFQKLASSENFAKLYTQFLLELPEYSKEGLQETRGEWIKYPQHTDPQPLVDSLEGYPLEWCTADRDTASTQLKGGDFYVYYSLDDDGKARIPRVAIRMEDDSIAEVRGIAHNQNLDPYIADVVASKMGDFPDGESYTRKAADMHQLTSIEQQLKHNPEMPLTQDQLIFLYELDHSIEGFGYQRDPRIDEIKASRGERDSAELRILAVEILRRKFEASYQGYNTIVSQLNEIRPPHEHVPIFTPEHVKNLFEAKMAEWEVTGVLKFVADKIIEDGTLHTLVITPNTLADHGEIISLAQRFGQGQLYETFVYDELYSQYSPTELSGELEPGQAGIRFSLVPSKYTSELGSAPAQQQHNTLKQLQVDQTDLHWHVPSLLEALGNWQARRAGGDKLDTSTAYETTVIRHIDLEPKELEGYPQVPDSLVNFDGKPFLDRGDARPVRQARAAVG